MTSTAGRCRPGTGSLFSGTSGVRIAGNAARAPAELAGPAAHVTDGAARAGLPPRRCRSRSPARTAPVRPAFAPTAWSGSPPLTANRIDVSFPRVRQATIVTSTGQLQTLPVGLSRLAVPALAGLRPRHAARIGELHPALRPGPGADRRRAGLRHLGQRHDRRAEPVPSAAGPAVLARRHADPRRRPAYPDRRPRHVRRHRPQPDQPRPGRPAWPARRRPAPPRPRRPPAPPGPSPSPAGSRTAAGSASARARPPTWKSTRTTTPAGPPR